MGEWAGRRVAQCVLQGSMPAMGAAPAGGPVRALGSLKGAIAGGCTPGAASSQHGPGPMRHAAPPRRLQRA